MAMNISRRGFLQGGLAAGALAALGSPRLAFSASGGTGHAVVFIFLRGGMDGLSAVVPAGEPAYYDLRPTIAIPEDQLIGVDGFFGLHPALAPLEPALTEGELAAVPATGVVEHTRSHFDAQAWIEAGVAGLGNQGGWLGRHLASAAPTDCPFRSVGVGRAPQRSLGGFGDSLAMTQLDQLAIDPPGGFDAALVGETLGAMYQRAFDLTLEEEAGQALGALAAAEEAALSDTPLPDGYGNKNLDKHLHLVAQLIDAGLGLEVACIDTGGWDLHANMGSVDGGTMRSRLAELGVALAAFREEVAAHWANVTVIALSEFGRRVQQNASFGTDHGRGGAMFVLGGAVNGGGVHGDWPGLNDLENGDLRVANDYRLVLAELVDRRLGNGASLAEVFPGYGVRPSDYLGLFA